MSIKKFIGTKAFYRSVLAITIPIIIQNGITNFVNLLDNVMVGRLGTEQLSGVGIANQLIFVFTLCLFGGLAGAGIFTAQFFGKGDHEGLRFSIRFKLYTALAILAVGGAILIPFGEELITLFLTEGDTTGDVALTLFFGREYLPHTARPVQAHWVLLPKRQRLQPCAFAHLKVQTVIYPLARYNQVQPFQARL